jgi:hypothetical protein
VLLREQSQDGWPPGKSGLGSQNRTILCHWGCGSLQIVSESFPSLRWWERTQAQWGTPTGMLGPKRGWLWRPTSPENEDVLICINAPFMTQRVLKSWWSWTYQNSAVKRASARAIPWWVTSWEVWFGEPKADNIVSLGVGRYKWYQSHCPVWDGGSVHKPNEGRQRGCWVQRGGDCDVPHPLRMRMCLYV